GRAFVEDPMEQLWGAIQAVFRSWNAPRAVTYRQLHDIPDHWGTAVNVQAMVFGNMGNDSATGVAFTRNPATGVKELYGEFLVNAQGEDVVAGIRTPRPLQEMEQLMPEVFQQLLGIFGRLEKHYRDVQDVEFTVERGRLWMLQTRNGKRTARAALKIVCDFMDEGLVTEQEALLRIAPKSLDQLLHPTLDPQAPKVLLAQGLPASPGGVSGRIVLHSEKAVEWKARGEKVILVRLETSPEDIAGMNAAVGILTSRGGMTSHAAVVARGMGKCCIVGCGELQIDEENKTVRARGYLLKEGDTITLDGSSGEVYLGEVPSRPPELSQDFERIMNLADRFRRLQVRANADTPTDAQLARRFGAQGIGLCRTEHMFFGADRIDYMRRMILASSSEERAQALKKLLPIQQKDFYEIFKEMKGLPVTIRLLDPPLHEFVPHGEKEIREFAQRNQLDFAQVKSQVQSLHEFNPMLGHRGCRLGISYPEIYRMQVQAIAGAAAQLVKEGISVQPEIMIPLVATAKEMRQLRALVEEEVKKVQQQMQITFDYAIGTMIELPRAALVADQLAVDAEFFSFGTNDLTQTTLGLSRDDAGRFLPQYVEQGIYAKDPFVTLDRDGVGALVKTGIDLGRKSRPKLKIGVCGEHGGDPDSIEFFHGVGLDYVSCSPFRVPVARLSAAQAAIKQEVDKK
ncbi:MAG: pyruvate, phosphate dikinase, partial [Pseudobdellovibrionaceae bacterium]|nr:pyruvate, phosphate dikinase [Pseudobdellovibrionaceae bacterium]